MNLRIRGVIAVATAAVAVGNAGAASVRLGLDEAVARARRSSPALSRLHAVETSAEFGIVEARAGRRPWVEANASYTHRSDVPEFAIQQPGAPPQTIFPNIPDVWRSRVAASWPLYTGGRLEAVEDAARMAREAARSDAAAGDADVAFETTQAYWNLVTARETVTVLAAGMEAYDRHVTESRHREESGLVPRNEVLAVQVDRDRAELALIEARAAAVVAEADLARLTGLSPGTAIEPTDAPDPVTSAAEPLDALVEQALAARPERGALDARRRALEAKARAEKATRLPTLAAGAGYEYARPNPRIMPPEDRFASTWEVSLHVAWSVFDGGRASAAAGRARTESEAVGWQLTDLDQRIRLDVTARKLGLDAAVDAIAVAERGLEAAATSLRIVQDRHVEGLAPSTERLDAEAAWLRAGLDRTAALARGRMAAARLDRALGR